MAKAQIDLTAVGGGGADYALFSVLTWTGNTTLTINDLVVGKKYLVVLEMSSSNATTSKNKATISGITGGTKTEVSAPNSVQANSGYLGYSAYIITPSATSVTLTRADYTSGNDVVMVFE